MDWLVSLLLGALQGLTEFLPVSSSGHLAVSEGVLDALRGQDTAGAEKLFFNVMLHLGTLAAILIYYRAVARTSLRGLQGDATTPPEYRRGALIRTGWLAILATLPAVVVALTLKDQVEEATDNPIVAGFGFWITAALLLVTARFQPGEKGPSRTTPLDALLIGAAQAFAILPGVSRSGMTIAAALALGLNRSWAVGFSLLMAVPAILGAGVLEIKDVNPDTLTPDRVAQTIAASLTAGLLGYAAIIWLIKIVRTGRLWYFSVYLVVLGGVTLAGFSMWGGRPDDRQTRPLDRAIRRSAEGPGVTRRPGQRPQSLARSLGVSPGAGPAHAEPPSRCDARASRLDVG